MERYTGMSVAVDAMHWLQKGVYGCDVKRRMVIGPMHLDDCACKSLFCDSGIKPVLIESCRSKILECLVDPSEAET